MVDEAYVSLDWFYDEIKQGPDESGANGGFSNELNVPLGQPDSPQPADEIEPPRHQHHLQHTVGPSTSHAAYRSNQEMEAAISDYPQQQNDSQASMQQQQQPEALQQQSTQFETLQPYNPNQQSQQTLSYQDNSQLDFDINNIDFGLGDPTVSTNGEMPMDCNINQEYSMQQEPQQQYSQGNAQMEGQWMQIDQSNLQMSQAQVQQSVVYTSTSQQMLRIPDSSQQGMQPTYTSQPQQIMSTGSNGNTILTNMQPVQQIHSQTLNQQQQQPQVHQFEINGGGYVTQQIFVDQQSGQQHFLPQNSDPNGSGYQQAAMVQVLPQNVNIMQQQNNEPKYVAAPPQQPQRPTPAPRSRAKPQNRNNSRKKPQPAAQTTDSLIKGPVEVRMNDDMQMKLFEMSNKMNELTQREAMGQDVSQEKAELDKQMAEMLNGCLKGANPAPAPAPAPAYQQPMQQTFVQQQIPAPAPKPTPKKKPTKAELQRKQAAAAAAAAAQKPQPVQTIEMPMQSGIPVDINDPRYQYGGNECYLVAPNGQLTKAVRVHNPATNTMTYQIQGPVDHEMPMMIAQQPTYISEVPAAVAAVVNSLESKPKATKKSPVKKGMRKVEPETEIVPEPAIFCVPSTSFEPPKAVVRPLVSELNRKIVDKREIRRQKIFDFVEQFKKTLSTVDLETPFKNKEDVMSRLLPYFIHMEPNFSTITMEKVDHELHRHRLYNEARKDNILNSMKKIFVNEAMNGDSMIDETMLMALDLEYEKQQLEIDKRLAAEDLQKFVDNSEVLQSNYPPSREAIDFAREQLHKPKPFKSTIRGFSYEPSRFDEEAVRARKVELEAEDRRLEEARLSAAMRRRVSPPKVVLPPRGKSPDPIIISRAERQPEKVKSIKIKLSQPQPSPPPPPPQPKPSKRSHSSSRDMPSSSESSSGIPRKQKLPDATSSRPKEPYFAVPELPVRRSLPAMTPPSKMDIDTVVKPRKSQEPVSKEPLQPIQEEANRKKHKHRHHEDRPSKRSKHSESSSAATSYEPPAKVKRPSYEPPTKVARPSSPSENVTATIQQKEKTPKAPIASVELLLPSQPTPRLLPALPVKSVPPPMMPVPSSSAKPTTKPPAKDPHFTSSDEEEEEMIKVREKSKIVIKKTEPTSSNVPAAMSADDLRRQEKQKRKEEKRRKKQEKKERREKEEKEKGHHHHDLDKERRRQERREEKERLKRQAEEAQRQIEIQKAQRQAEAEKAQRQAEVEKAQRQAEAERAQRQAEAEKLRHQAEMEKQRQAAATPSHPAVQPIRINFKKHGLEPFPSKPVEVAQPSQPPLKMKLFKTPVIPAESKSAPSTADRPSSSKQMTTAATVPAPQPAPAPSGSFKIRFNFGGESKTSVIPSQTSVTSTPQKEVQASRPPTVPAPAPSMAPAPTPSTNPDAPGPSKHKKRKDEMTSEELLAYKRDKKEKKLHHKKEKSHKRMELGRQERVAELEKRGLVDTPVIDLAQKAAELAERQRALQVEQPKINEDAEAARKAAKAEKKRLKEEKRARKQEKHKERPPAAPTAPQENIVVPADGGKLKIRFKVPQAPSATNGVPQEPEPTPSSSTAPHQPLKMKISRIPPHDASAKPSPSTSTNNGPSPTPPPLPKLKIKIGGVPAPFAGS